jgi:hypothetical protein
MGSMLQWLGISPKNGGGVTLTGPTQPGSNGPSREGTSSGEIDVSTFVGPPATQSSKFVFEATNFIIQTGDVMSQLGASGTSNTSDANTPAADKKPEDPSHSITFEYCTFCTKPGDTVKVDNSNRGQHNGFTNRDLEKRKAQEQPQD